MNFDFELRSYLRDPNNENAQNLAKVIARLFSPSNNVDVAPSSEDLDYNLQVSLFQLQIIQKALEYYGRIGLGQLNYLNEIIAPLHPGIDHGALSAAVELLKRMALPHMSQNGSYGVGHPKVHINAHTAFDLDAVIRQQIAKDENHGSHSVWHHPPLHYNRSQPLPKIEKLDE